MSLFVKIPRIIAVITELITAIQSRMAECHLPQDSRHEDKTRGKLKTFHSEDLHAF